MAQPRREIDFTSNRSRGAVLLALSPLIGGTAGFVGAEVTMPTMGLIGAFVGLLNGGIWAPVLIFAFYRTRARVLGPALVLCTIGAAAWGALYEIGPSALASTAVYVCGGVAIGLFGPRCCPTPVHHPGTCEHCGYDRRGSLPARCPECGSPSPAAA